MSGKPPLSIIPHPDIREVGEGDALGGGVAALLHAAIVDHLVAVAGAQLVESGIKALVFFDFVAGAGRIPGMGIAAAVPEQLGDGSPLYRIETPTLDTPDVDTSKVARLLSVAIV